MSIAITRPRRRARAHCTAQRPTGPRPSTTTTSPGRDAAVDDRVVAGAHDVAGEERDVVERPGGHAPERQVRVRHQHLLGLRALQVAEALP